MTEEAATTGTAPTNDSDVQEPMASAAKVMKVNKWKKAVVDPNKMKEVQRSHRCVNQRRERLRTLFITQAQRAGKAALMMKEVSTCRQTLCDDQYQANFNHIYTSMVSFQQLHN